MRYAMSASCHQQLRDPVRLRARLQSPTKSGPPPGVYRLNLRTTADALLVVPAASHPTAGLPLLVMLHGAGEHAAESVGRLAERPGEYPVLLLAPTAIGQTWDGVRGEIGDDAQSVDEALAWVFERFAVDRQRLVLAGFSDGGSYALRLGLANGSTFTHVMAFSPGVWRAVDRQGHPRLFVSHGIRDDVLPIEICSRVIVAELRRHGYDVLYREFDGAHVLPEGIVQSAMTWLICG